MNEFYLTGTLHTDSTLHGTRYILNAANERLVDLFVVKQDYGNNTREDAVWAVRKYLHHFEILGQESLGTVTVEDVRRFILKAAAEVKPASLHNLFLYLRHFHIYLKDTGVDAPDCVELFSHKVYRDMPLQGYVTDQELICILEVIDTSTESGKRNRAIILLGATTGLRAGDIIRLKLTDIDWRQGKIHVRQSKTNQTVSLPLLEMAGTAIQDYILNARPESECPEVFLRCIPPKIAIQDAVCVGTMFKDYERRAGIERHPFDGKGFHGLQRRLAKKLLVSGNPLTMIAQILGHDDIKSALQYLALDVDNLKRVCSGFFRNPCRKEGTSVNLGFVSRFGGDLTGMIELKVSLGGSENTYLSRAQNFDRFCAEEYPDAEELTADLAISWIKTAECVASAVHSKIAFERGFATYLHSIGKSAHILPERFAGGKAIFVPYIFTDG